jgi:hypothetical protein
MEAKISAKQPVVTLSLDVDNVNALTHKDGSC